MAKRKAVSQIDNLTPNHKKSAIDPTPMRAGGVHSHDWKAFDESYNFASDFILIGGLSKDL